MESKLEERQLSSWGYSAVLFGYECSFSVLGQVQSNLFFFLINPNSPRPHYIHHFYYKRRYAHCPCEGSECSHSIFVKLRRISKGQAVITPVSESVLCKYSRKKSPCKASYTMDCPGIKCIVPFPLVLEYKCCIANHCCYNTN